MSRSAVRLRNRLSQHFEETDAVLHPLRPDVSASNEDRVARVREGVFRVLGQCITLEGETTAGDLLVDVVGPSVLVTITGGLATEPQVVDRFYSLLCHYAADLGPRAPLREPWASRVAGANLLPGEFADLQARLRRHEDDVADELVRIAEDPRLEADARALALEVLSGARVQRYEPRVVDLIGRFVGNEPDSLQFGALAAVADVSKQARSRLREKVRAVADAEGTPDDIRRAALAVLAG